MKEDYKGLHIGEVCLPPRTEEEMEKEMMRHK